MKCTSVEHAIFYPHDLYHVRCRCCCEHQHQRRRRIHHDIGAASKAVAEFGSNEQTNKCKNDGRDAVRNKKTQLVLPLVLIIPSQIRANALCKERWHWPCAIEIHW